MRRRDFSNHLDKSTIPGMTGGKTGDGFASWYLISQKMKTETRPPALQEQIERQEKKINPSDKVRGVSGCGGGT